VAYRDAPLPQRLPWRKHVVALDEFVLRIDQVSGPDWAACGWRCRRTRPSRPERFLAAANSGDLAQCSLECPACRSTDVRTDRRVSRGGTVVNDFMGVPVADAAVSFTCVRCGRAWE
jgi:hypothetical protein